MKKQIEIDGVNLHPMFTPWIFFNTGNKSVDLVSRLDTDPEAIGLHKLNPRRYYWPEAPERKKLHVKPGGHVQLLHSFYNVFASDGSARTGNITHRPLQDL